MKVPLLFALIALPTIALAVAPYTPLVGIPGLTNQSNASLAQYINRIYIFTVTAGAILGVIKIGIAGVKYSMSDVITDKASAKKDIWGVLLGLAILLLPYIVLNTIYGNLTNLNVLDVNNKIRLDQSSANTGGNTP